METNDSTVVTCRMETAMWHQALAAARKHGVSAAEFIRAAVRQRMSPPSYELPQAAGGFVNLAYQSVDMPLESLTRNTSGGELHASVVVTVYL